MSDPRFDGGADAEEYVPDEWTIEHEAEGLDEEAEKAETVLLGVERAIDETSGEVNPAEEVDAYEEVEDEEDFPRVDDFPTEEDPRLIDDQRDADEA